MAIFDKKYRFTSSRHSKRGLMALIFGMISFISFILANVISIRTKGGLTDRMGGVGLFALLFAFAGLISGLSALQEPDVFRILPRTAFAISLVSVILWFALIYIGIVGISYE